MSNSPHPEHLATDALVGKFFRTAAAVEWQLKSSLGIWKAKDADAKPVGDRRQLAGLTKAMRNLEPELRQKSVVAPYDAADLIKALDDIEKYRPLRNTLAHAVINQHRVGLAIRSTDGTTTPLLKETIDEAGSAMIWVATVLDDIRDQMGQHLDD